MKPSFLWTQLWTTCLTFQAFLCVEAAERGSGVLESRRWAGGVAGLPDDFPKTRPAASREIPLAAQREGMGWEEHGAGLSTE